MILNGQLPATMLAPVPWDPRERLQPGALADLVRLNDAFRTRFGHDLVINDSYRNLGRQRAYYANPPSGVGTAAEPGTSNHGWALAVDLKLTAEEYAWMLAHAPAFGWTNPPWARDGRGVEEPWHWEHTWAGPVVPVKVTGGTTPPTSEEDIVASLEELRAVVRESRPWYKIAGTDLAWEDLGAARRAGSRARWEGSGRPPIVTLDLTDPFWRLPIVGVQAECYRRPGQEAAWFVELELDGVGTLVRRWPGRAGWEAEGCPTIRELAAGHPIWALRAVGTLPPEGA